MLIRTGTLIRLYMYKIYIYTTIRLYIYIIDPKKYMVIIELVIAPHKLGEFIPATRFKNIVRGDSER